MPARSSTNEQCVSPICRITATYDIKGSLVMRLNSSKVTGKAKIDLPVSVLAAGKYFVNIYDNNKLIGKTGVLKAIAFSLMEPQTSHVILMKEGISDGIVAITSQQPPKVFLAGKIGKNGKSSGKLLSLRQNLTALLFLFTSRLFPRLPGKNSFPRTSPLPRLILIYFPRPS